MFQATRALREPLHRLQKTIEALDKIILDVQTMLISGVSVNPKWLDCLQENVAQFAVHWQATVAALGEFPVEDIDDQSQPRTERRSAKFLRQLLEMRDFVSQNLPPAKGAADTAWFVEGTTDSDYREWCDRSVQQLREFDDLLRPLELLRAEPKQPAPSSVAGAETQPPPDPQETTARHAVTLLDLAMVIGDGDDEAGATAAAKRWTSGGKYKATVGLNPVGKLGHWDLYDVTELVEHFCRRGDILPQEKESVRQRLIEVARTRQRSMSSSSQDNLTTS